eukprot:TRINITY_DN15447_c0_g1_i1.p1 TRINITY_DN15447_c0_g1~~TRINITY_DN15447_c0_g1_i1.p1  ORF type:complete len:488 (-),score=70.60 TRINITY_DN15447_c0_g1_i1:58-1521(-)
MPLSSSFSRSFELLIPGLGLCIAAAVVWRLASRRKAALPDVQQRSGRKCRDPEVLAGVEEVRRKYELSEVGGFLPESCTSAVLPSALECFEDLARKLPQLNQRGELRKAVDALSSIDVSEVFKDMKGEALRRAYVVLGMLGHAYIHGPSVPWHILSGAKPASTISEEAAKDLKKKLPKQLAKPWLEACHRLKMPAVLTSGACDLWNWKLRDPSGKATVGNLDQIFSATGTETERSFHMVPCAMMAVAGELTPKLFLADVLIRGNRKDELTSLLLEVTDVLIRFREIFGDIVRGVDVDVFYDVYRPLLGGFYPDGILMEADDPKLLDGIPCLSLVKEENQQVMKNCAKGPSAGQSTVILMIDTLLGVSHEKTGSEFQDEMLTYMPAPHRQMVLDFREKWRNTEPLPKFAARCKANGDPDGLLVAQAFDSCVCAVRDLRRSHLNTVSRYLTRTSTGTGSSTWRLMLQAMLDRTEARRNCEADRSCKKSL